MGITAYHIFTSPVADGTNTQLVRPSNWNSEHALTLNAVGSEISNAFSNGGGVSFGLETNGKITASAPSGGGGAAISAGANSQSTGTVIFSNSNGVTFGLNAGTMTASHNGLTTAMASNRGSDFVQATAAFAGTNASGTIASNGISVSVGNYITTARASNDGIGLNSAFTAGPLLMTINSSGLSLNADSAAGTTSGFGGNLISGSMTHNTAGLNLSLNHPAWLTTAMQSNAATISNVRVSAGTTSNLLSAITFSNSNGVSFGINGSTMTASHNGLTTARASNDAIGLNTALTANGVAWTVNSSGLSLNVPAFLTTAAQSDHSHGNPTLFLTNISGTTASASNGFTLSLSAAAPGGGAAINVSAGTTSGNVQTIQFDNGNGVSFGLNGSTITASVNAGGGGVAIADGGGTQTSGTVQFSNSNNITFGLNNGTMTASYADPAEVLFFRPNDFVTTVGAPIVNSASIVYLPIDHNLTATRFDLIASINVATAANNSSAGFLYSATAVLFTKNGATLSSLSSATTANQMTWSSNATGSVTGAFFLSIPMNVNAQADKYWAGIQLSTRATGLTGAATTSLANTVTMMGVNSAQVGAFSIREPGANTSNSGGWFSGMGMYSGTSNYSTIGFSNITQQGSNMQRANIALRMFN